MHLVFRLSDHPVRVFRGATAEDFGTAVVGGTRSSYYVKDISVPTCSVGVQLQPGASYPVFGVKAGELAGRHWRLGDLWGREAASMRERLQEASDPERQLDLMERLLAERLPKVRGIHPAVAMALERFTGTSEVSEVVAESGYSHRRFIALFQETVGLTPKVYCRVHRFRRALAHATEEWAPRWIDVALAAGYSDQAHLNREFLEFAGVTPTEYRRLAPTVPEHLTARNRPSR